MKPLWAIAGVVLLGTAGIAGTIVVASPSGDEEVIQQVETASPTATANGEASPTPTLSPAVLPSPTPEASATASTTVSPAPAPEGFAVYTHAGSKSAPAHSFAYPSQWFLTGGNEPPESAVGFGFVLTPWDPATAPDRGGIPYNTMKLDMHVIPIGFEEGTLSTSRF